MSIPSRSRPRFPARRRPENTLPSNEHHFTHTGYDAAGNQTSSETPAGAVTTNVWDDEGLRSSVILPNSIISTTIYNGDGQLVEREHGADGAVRLIWDGSQMLAETDAADVTQTLFTHSPCAGPISQRGAASEFLHYDGQGSTVNVTDIVEWILQIIKYDPYGNIIYDQPSGSSSSTSPTESPYMWLARSGLLYIWDLAESLNLRSVYNSEQWRDLSPQTGGSDGALFHYPGNAVFVYLRNCRSKLKKGPKKDGVINTKKGKIRIKGRFRSLKSHTSYEGRMEWTVTDNGVVLTTYIRYGKRVLQPNGTNIRPHVMIGTSKVSFNCVCVSGECVADKIVTTGKGSGHTEIDKVDGPRGRDELKVNATLDGKGSGNEIKVKGNGSFIHNHLKLRSDSESPKTVTTGIEKLQKSFEWIWQCKGGCS